MTKPMERPADLDAFVGQRALVARLRIVMNGAIQRETKPPHVLLSGPAGTGKTTMARIVAHELGAKLNVTSGPALRRPGDLAGLLMAGAGDNAVSVLFIDEIHRLPIRVEETLYEALEDGSISVVVGKGTEARAITFPLPPLVVVGATTKAGALSAPLRDRFGFHATMATYSEAELAEMVGREWRRQDFAFAEEAALVVARRAKGVPRVALNLAARVLDVAAVSGVAITTHSATRALEAFGIGDGGYDEVDWLILRALTGKFAGRAVGLDALAQSLDTDASTIENGHEGALVRAGLVVRTSSGRMATPAAYDLVRGANS